MNHVPASLQLAIAEADHLAPHRSKASDGTVASAAHHNQNPTSDHEIGARGLCHALDLTNDPPHGWDVHARLDQVRVRQDPRVKYVISNRRIAGPGSRAGGWEWHPYTGTNPHEKHGHMSIWSTVVAENDLSPWFVTYRIPTIEEATVAINKPAVRILPTATGNGYFVVAADGGVFTYGDAVFFGSAAGQSAAPIVDAELTPSGAGCWLLASDGGVFTLGDAQYLGSPNA